MIGDGGASCPCTNMKVASSLVKNCQHFPCRIKISQDGRWGGAGKVRGGDCRALDGEGVGGDRSDLVCASGKGGERAFNIDI